MPQSPHRAEIDGLRAVAVVPVVLFHAGLGCSGGYVGVDVFFVISGYLITALLGQAFVRGEFSLGEFWQRRVRRIVPALVAMLAATLVAGWCLLLPDDLLRLGRATLAQGLLISNFHFWQKSGYFDAPAESSPLLHTWSLAVEEQFYLLLPLVLLVALRGGVSRLRVVLGALWVGSLGLSWVGVSRFPTATFYLLPARAWELLLGSCLAVLPGAWGRGPVSEADSPSPAGENPRGGVVGIVFRELVSAAGLLAIGWTVWQYDRQTVFPGPAALWPTGGTAAVIWANSGRLTWTGRLLALRPLVFLGQISYSWYLWHWPPLVYARYWSQGELALSHKLGLVCGSLVLAVLSWRLIETPFRQRVYLPTAGRLWTGAGLAWGVLTLAGGVYVLGKGWPARLPPQVLAFHQARHDRAFLHNVSLAEAQAGRWIELGTGDRSRRPEVLVWGDSHAMAVLPAVDAICRRHGLRGVAATYSATAPVLGWVSPSPHGLGDNTAAFHAAVLEYVRQQQIPQVWLVARWSWYLSAAQGQREGDQVLHEFSARIQATVAALRSTGARVTLLKEVPCHPHDVPTALAKAAWRGDNLEQVALRLAEHRQQTAEVERLWQSWSERDGDGVAVVDPLPWFLDDQGRCVVQREGRALYRDEHHLSVYGAQCLEPWLAPHVVPTFAQRESTPAVRD